ncbi:helix-turn-helix domain-containing protein [Mucilaginibacter sp. OK098]|uniref:helix-turn-helix domain-containing protein n=1 Tax=Mucilaginibacter sp. OK098 TaxID=1855297 RepID=UPI00091A39DB|nr:helix-turn-helix transcriptional regulator [Mucilaginibacter sp. OK098]SHN31920.1 Helix-turn-helix [Mucilaginibacter sp. OK098]
MTLSQKIFAARNKKGITQEELAGLMKVSVRTIQRIESGESSPRKYTLKAVAEALDLSFEELSLEPADDDREETKHFLILLCVSCFSYLLLPYIHFLIPSWLLKNRKEQNAVARQFARKVIRTQIYWIIATMLFFLLVLLINFLLQVYLSNPRFISYLLPFFIMYVANAIIIIFNLRRVQTLSLN